MQPDPNFDEMSHVFIARGLRWKRLRSITAPSFSVTALRGLMPLLHKVLV